MTEFRVRRYMAGGALGLLCFAFAWCAELTGDEAERPSGGEKTSSVEQADEEARVSIDVARDRAKLMHQIYSSTLKVMHHRYFNHDKAVVPARAMEDIFFDVSWRSKIEARWISANLPAMGIGHEPRDDFEKQAAKEIGAGKDEYEAIENGTYRRAGAIPLGAGCIQCHAGSFGMPPKNARYAGLVISMPVSEK